MSTKYVHGIIAGHGGINPLTGEYVTPGKRAVVNGKNVYEGYENRLIKEITIGFAHSQGIEVLDLIPGWEDVEISERVKEIGKQKQRLRRQGKELIVWELHLNAFNGSAHGREVFTTTRKNFSDEMAEQWMLTADKLIPGQKRRVDESDGDLDKEKNFKLIRESACFACLIEFYFFDNPKEVKKFMNPRGRALLASTLIETFKKIDSLD